MADLHELRGRVIGPDRRPVPGAIVMIPAASVPVPEIALIANVEGAFIVRLPRGRFTFRAIGPDGAGQVEVNAIRATDFEIVTVPEGGPNQARAALEEE